MYIMFDHVHINSRSGPNHFSSKLATQFRRMGHSCTFLNNNMFAVGSSPPPAPDIKLSFIETNTQTKAYPMVLRLDGIYFDPRKDYNYLNKNIERSYKMADGIVFQSKYNRDIVFKYFGKHPRYTIINNGADIEFINNIKPLEHPKINKFETVWCCASKWRDWKRLKENIRYFLECSSDKDYLIVAGEVDPKKEGLDDRLYQHPRIFFVGDVGIEILYSIYKRAKYFIHLARYDSCPNVVVDARAAGCQIICSSIAGTKEVAGLDAIVVHDELWDYNPVSTAYLPDMLFDKTIKNTYDTNIDITEVSKRYEDFLKEIL